MIGDSEKVVVEERIVLSKFEGDPLPGNEIERMHILNGEVVSIEKIENGEVVDTQLVREV
jgi:hypothetical protein